MALAKKVGMVIHPVDDLDRAEAFYRDALGLDAMFRDGDRFADEIEGGQRRIIVAAKAHTIDARVGRRALGDDHISKLDVGM